MLQGKTSSTCKLPEELIKAGYAVYDAFDQTGRFDRLYAIALPPNLPYRLNAIESYGICKSEHLQKLLAYGVTYVSALNECRYCLVFRQPEGKPLSELFAVTKLWNERNFVDQIIKPIFKLIQFFSARQVLLGNLNPDTIFVNQAGKVTVCEFISCPPGFSQQPDYEPLERVNVNPYAKGDGDATVDLFALAASIIQSCIGSSPQYESLSPEERIVQRFFTGSYNAVMGARSLPPYLDDFVRSAMNDNPMERWSIQQTETWAGGRKFNIIRPTHPKEATRSLAFNNNQYFNRRHLAHVMATDWKEAKRELRDTKVIRWLQLSVSKPELADDLRRVLSACGGEGRPSAADDELVSRSLTMLDPFGPLRFKDMTVAVDGIGCLLAEYYRHNRQDLISTIGKIIELGLPGFCLESNADLLASHPTDFAKLFEQTRTTLRSKGMGLGLERVLYDLNPTLPCQSQLVVKDVILTLEDLLTCLDAKGAKKSHDGDPMDRHIAAFIASRINLEGELKLGTTDANPAFKNNSQMMMIAFLNRAQKKTGGKPLPGLTKWLSSRLTPLVNGYHSRATKLKLAEKLKEVAEIGQIEKIYMLFSDNDQIEKDQLGYNKALATAQANKQVVDSLKNDATRSKTAYQYAMQISSILALIAVSISVFHTLRM